ncbi:hypothetical protein [uncultured Subdoligranulum sp.]|uniref:hypothetical protein n=1 Tax=uncultured Subdoligranulum sp. TaxID=512298 RepID=UPI002630A1AE|nr:hypothetical protein [uncultured Subdoligranulum sp.]
MNLPKTSFLHRDIIKQHKVFTAIVVLQCLVILWLLVGLFRPAFSLTILPQDFSAAVEEKSDSQYQAQMAEESLQFQIAEEAKRAPESEGEANFEQLESQGYAIRSGAYEVTIQYQTDSTSANIRAAEVSFEELRFYNLVYGEPITLTGAWSTVTGRLWIPLGANAKELVAQVTPLGECNFQIESITLQEQPVYRLIRLVGILLLFGIVNGIGLALFTEGTWDPWNKLKKHWTIVVLSLVCIFACIPLFGNGLLIGDDLDFHLTRIVSLAQGLSDGQFPVRLYTDMLNGYGYATPLYYCDLFLYIPAILYNCMVPLQVCYKLYVMLITIFTVGVTYWAMSEIVKAKDTALVGTLIYVLANYRISNVYCRAAVGEYTAMAWLPLIVLGIYRIFQSKSPSFRDGVPLAIGVAFIAQSHVLSLEMVLLFLVLFCFANINKMLATKRMLTLFKEALLSVGLCSWFIVPMLCSMLTQRTTVTGAGGSTSFQSTGLSVYNLFALFSDVEDPKSYKTIGLSLIVGSLIAVYVLLKRCSWKVDENSLIKWTLLFGWGAVFFSLNLFPWDCVLSYVSQTLVHKVLTIVQYSWRYMTIATILLSVTITVSLKIIKQKNDGHYKCLCTALILLTMFNAGDLYRIGNQTRDLEMRYSLSENDRVVVMQGEYLLSKDVDWNYPRPSTQDEELLIKWYDKTDGVAHITLDNTGDTEATVVLPIFDYGNYHAVDTEGTEWTLGTSENSLLQLTVPAGYSGSFSIQYKEPIWWRAAELVSLATFVGLVGVWVKDKKKKRQLHKLPGDLAG